MPGKLEAYGLGRSWALNERKAQPAPSFPTLLGEAAWMRLAAPIRARFGPKAAYGYFTGDAWFHASWFGRAVAWSTTLFGRPLPTLTGRCQARVTIRPGDQGAIWDRTYARGAKKAQHVRSIKRQVGTTLFECAGPLWMRLRLEERNGALAFVSTGFLIALGPVRLRLPDWMTPGRLEVIHTDHGNGRFAFTLTCDHPLFGRVFDQVVELSDETPKEVQP